MQQEQYWKKDGDNWEQVLVPVKNSYPMECVCGLYMNQEWYSEPIENCVHCDQITMDI